MSVAGAAAAGQIVVNGDEIAFFNANACGLSLPEGVGRYRWRISGDALHLKVIGEEPCGGRRPVLNGATYERSG